MIGVSVHFVRVTSLHVRFTFWRFAMSSIDHTNARLACMINLPADTPASRVSPMRFALIALLCSALLASAESPKDASAVDFAKDVWPILKDRCVQCHNADKHKGGFELTSRD